MFFCLMFLNIYYWEKLTFSKLAGKANLSERKFEKIHQFEEQKGTRYIRENIYFGITIFSCLLPAKPCLRFLLNCFVQEIKGFYWSFLGKEVDFRDIMNIFPNILAKNKNFKKFRHSLVGERALITTTLICPYHWKTLALFCLHKKRLKAYF